MKKCDDYLHEKNSMLEHILAQAKILHSLEKDLKTLLEKEWRDEVQVCALKQGKLLLSTPNANVHTRLRYQSQELLSQLRKAGYHELTGILIKMNAHARSTIKTPMPARKTYSSIALNTLKNLLRQLKT